MTLVAASLVERGIAGASRSSKKAFSAGADLVELRLDHMPGLRRERLAELRSAIPGKAIATLRSKAEGGRSALKGRRRAALLEEIISAGFEYIDLELRTDRALLHDLQRSRPPATIVSSAHFARPVPKEQVESTLTEACRRGDIGKVAMPCDHAGHALMLAEVALKFSKLRERFALIGMREQGLLTRACASDLGSAIAYACIPGRPAAPGQLDISAQRSMAGDRKLVLGLIGHPVSHSVSAPMHEAALRRARLSGIYLLLDVPPDWLSRDTLEMLASAGFAGVNVTIPHKRAVAQMCDRLGAAAASTGAVNTVKFDRGLIVGENTDCYGFSKLIEGKTTLSKGTEALVIGAGGAARAVAHVLSSHGARLTVAARRLPQASEVAQAFGGKAVRLNSLRGSGGRFDIIVNSTPLGMKGRQGANPVPPDLLSRGSVLFDLVYNPQVTPAMRAAKARNARAYNGLEMLVHQGARAFQMWSGKRPDVDAMRRSAKEALR